MSKKEFKKQTLKKLVAKSTGKDSKSKFASLKDKHDGAGGPGVKNSEKY